MLRGLYTAASGMLVQMIRNDVVANNLANATTIGFKRDLATVRAFPTLLIHRRGDPADSSPAQAGWLGGMVPPPVGLLGTGAAVDDIAPIFT
ncbi:MAG TPA: flagellar basal body protein, partial [Limnochordia bacterium]